LCASFSPNSHAFRGGRVVVEHDGKDGPVCLVEFGDGITVIGEWRPAGGGIELRVPAYRTAKGKEVASGNWILARRKDGGWRSKQADGGL
jgi:hypothetical protein